MKKTQAVSAGIAFVLAITFSLHAQTTTVSIQSLRSASAGNLEVMLQAVEATTPLPAESVPQSGTFWSAQNINDPPFPSNINNLPAWDFGGGNWLLADQDFDYAALEQQMAAMRMLSRAMGLEMDNQEVADNSYTIDPNGLWLEITGVSNGAAWFNLHNSTNQVYAIWNTTDLLANWNVVTEVWPTNSTVMPFSVPMLERQNLFLRAEDWTGVDSNGDGIPDWWIWMYFGNLDETATNLDSQGNTLLSDYTNGIDPNVIQFSLQFTNQYVNTSLAYGTITVFGGVPAYEAFLVNDTNLADANWQPYSSNVVVSLNAGDGAYEVWVGLKGLPLDAYQTWHGFNLILDTVPPIITVTNPAAGVVSQPMIQVQGYANEALSSLTFDVSNAAGLWTNQTGYITSRYYDLNLLDFTTNWFQCYDIVLTNGLNTVTLHATDLAGNTTTTNVSFTLDYSGDTTPPALTVIWPQDGTAIGGSSFTLQAQVDDDTATVMAQIVDANGNTNTVQGLVERSGRVWVQNLPLAARTNTLTVTATDAAGNASVTDLTLVQSPVTVSMDPLPSDQQNQSYVNVTGTVSDPTCTVTVNGVQATVNPDGTWEADGVLASPVGVASFDVEAYAGSASSLVASRKSNSFVYANNNMGGISPASLVSSFKKSNSLIQANDAGPDNSVASQMLNQLQQATVVASDFSGIGHYDWTTNVNSLGQSNLVQDETLIWDYLSGGTWICSDSYYSEVITNFDGGGGSAGVPSFAEGINSWFFTPTFEYAALNDPNYQRIVQTKVMIASRGMLALAMGLTNTTPMTQSYLVRACAASFSQRIKPGNDDDFVNHDFFFNFITGGIWGQQWYAGDVPLPPEWFQINGQTLVNSGIVNSDGSVWGMTVVQGPAGANVDVTPTLIPSITLKTNDYTFYVQVGGLQIVDANTGTVLTGQTNKVIVGQQMNLKCQLMISNEVITVFPLTNFQWTVPGFAISNYVVAADASSAVVYTNFPTTKSNVVFYWVDGASNRAVQCSATAQGKTFTAQATFNVLRPTAKISPWTTSVNVNSTLGYEALVFDTSTDDGITFSNTMTIPNGFSGSNIWVQVIFSRIRQLQDTNLIWHVETENGSSPYGDTPIPYQGFEGPNLPADSPNLPLPPSGYVRGSAANSFEMWMMFQPPGGIWVPLRAVNWSWSSSATNSPNGWGLESGTNSVNPTDFDTQTYPLWNSDVRNRQYIPPLL
jgi:hypothetical protein